MKKHRLTVLSIGWGVQSWTLAAMAALGEIDTPDVILHADTTWEHLDTYNFAKQWTPWLVDHGQNVEQVCDMFACKRFTEDNNQAFMPLYTICKKTGSRGQLRRSCTERWKIRPQRKMISHYLSVVNLKKTEAVVNQLIGISMDEWTRMKDSGLKYVKLSFPLVDMKMSRADCISWLEDRNLPVPPKSSCIMCPYHSPFAWWQLKERGGRDWKQAIEVDNMIRNKRPGYLSFLTNQRVPLIDMDFSTFTDPSLFDLSEYTCDSGHCFL